MVALSTREPEAFYRQTIFRIARNWARVPSAPWDKVRDPLFTQCPNALGSKSAKDDRWNLDENAQAAIIGLGIYLLESNGCHAGHIVPYLLRVEDGLFNASFSSRKPGQNSKTARLR